MRTPIFNPSKAYQTYYRAVCDTVAVQLDCTNSDAQGLCDTQEQVIVSGHESGVPVHNTAQAVIDLCTTPDMN